MDPDAWASPVLIPVQIHHKIGVVAKRHWPRIKIDPGLFRFASQIGFNRLLGLHHLDRECEDEKERSKKNSKQRIQMSEEVWRR
jgi:hypothetical protein